MASKIVDRITRTGSATSPIRQLVAWQGKEDTVLGTPITKIEWPMEFRHGGSHIPVEQYAFQVTNRGKTRTYARFADATAVVMKIHNVEIAGNEMENAQIYVKRAVAILEGRDQLQVIESVNPNAVPAVANPAPTPAV